jgi:hypothetical protein
MPVGAERHGRGQEARVFASAGFTDSTADAFVSEIRRLASSGEVSETEDTPFGRKYTVIGMLASGWSR